MPPPMHSAMPGWPARLRALSGVGGMRREQPGSCVTPSREWSPDVHILGILYICLMLGALLSLGDVAGSWIQDRRARKVMGR
jgi:hypothetical protein